MKTITEQFIRTLNANLKSAQIRTNSYELELYSFDGLQLHKAIPGCVVLPESTEEISWIVKQCNKFKIPFVPRGAGTGLSGGAVISDGLIIQLSRLNKILEIDIPNKCAIVQPGVVNVIVILTSDFFYLRNNDVIYIEPLKFKGLRKSQPQILLSTLTTFAILFNV